MRRTFIGRPAELELEAQLRARAREALLFDLRDQTANADLALAERRVGSWTFAPGLMLIGHLILCATMLLATGTATGPGSFSKVYAALIAAMLLDMSAGAVMVLWRRLQMAPHTVSRLMCGYVGASGASWAFGSAAAANLYAHNGTLITLALLSGFFIRSIVSVSSPPLAVVNAIVAAATTMLFSGAAPVSFAVNAMAVMLVAYSVLVTQKTLVAGRRRLALEWQARKALNFVEEFEISGRGWFWETDHLGTLSYVSQQLAEATYRLPRPAMQ